MKFKNENNEEYFVLNGEIKKIGPGGIYETTDEKEIEELKKNKNFKEVRENAKTAKK